ncbi:MAG: hypothetical protein U0984_11395 [Prosthecobacter sp.]|nr:hypothetical protein [Prosthecobacter sp.]
MPNIKYGKMMGWLVLALLLVSAAPERKVRAELAPAPLRSGTTLEEQRQLLINAGEYKIQAEAGTQSLSLRSLQRVKLIRRLQSAENEDVKVEDFAEDVAFYGAAPPPPNEKLGILNQTHLHARKLKGQWLYELQEQKPSAEHAAALVKLAWMTSALELAALGIGTQLRTTGETWKTDFPAPRGKNRETAVLSDYQCTLESVEEIQGEKTARIAVQGKITLEQPTYKGASEVTFKGHVLRRLKDKVDVETKLEGNVSFTGPVTAAGKPATVAMKLPYVGLRTLRIVPR